jgi:hypothetical protein
MITRGGGGNGHPYSPPKQKVDRGFTLRPKASAPAPHNSVAPVYHPPAPSYSSNSSGQYSGGGGGGQPHNPPQPHPGHIGGAGHGGGGGNGGGHPNNPGGGGNAGPGKKAPAPKKPNIPGINKFLAGDSAYQDQLSTLMKQLEDFQTGNQSDQANVGEDFQSALAKMNQQKSQDLEALQNDFASRGLLNSGLYTDAVGNYDKGYQNNLNDLTTDRQRSLNDLLTSLQQYQQENTTAKSNARQEAIRRRAQQFGLQ